MVVKTVYDVIAACEDVRSGGSFQLTRHARDRSERRSLPKQFLFDTVCNQSLVGGVVQPPEGRLKLWFPMPDDAPLSYSEEKDLVLILAETGLDKSYNVITMYPEARSKRFHDD